MARPRGDRNAVRLSISLDEADHAEVKRLAGELDVSAAWVIRRAVAELVAKYRDSKPAELPLRRAG